ncbi:hypothetical protein CLIM01_04869 [Colletotrichum limetticola]|uniref:Uncharacterized protein n=1 Tax=Colletotrichum limetticola TaxID=1209924 RepID=A0ABQ9Q1V6_9PEZI|nr:hypothetical protein CLIM01_04869 [Colletotrichum limetticola]
MDSQGSQVTKKRRLDDGNEDSQASKDDGSSLGVSWRGFRPRTIEFDHQASCSEFESRFALEIWATDAQGVERQIGQIWDKIHYAGAEKVKIIAESATSPTSIDTPRLASDDYIETFRRHMEEEQTIQEKARQEEKARKEENARQEEKARKEEKEARKQKKEARKQKKETLRERTLALEALQARRRALQESERTLQYEEEALQEKIQSLQEK